MLLGAVNVTVVLRLYVRVNWVVPLPEPLLSAGLTTIFTPLFGLIDATVRAWVADPVIVKACEMLKKIFPNASTLIRALPVGVPGIEVEALGNIFFNISQ